MGYGTVLAVLLLVPTLVVLTFMRGLPDSSSGGFKKHDAGGSGSSRAAARPGPRLHEQLDSNGQQAKAGSAALGRSAGLGQPDRSRSSSQAGAKGAAAASLHADSAAQQQQELGQRGAVEQADQHTLEHRLQKQQQGGQKHEQIPNQAEAGQQQAQQVQQQAQQAQRQQQPQGRQQVRQGQVVRGQARSSRKNRPTPSSRRPASNATLLRKRSRHSSSCSRQQCTQAATLAGPPPCRKAPASRRRCLVAVTGTTRSSVQPGSGRATATPTQVGTGGRGGMIMHAAVGMACQQVSLHVCLRLAWLHTPQVIS